jgi:hypothetical protein
MQTRIATRLSGWEVRPTDGPDTLPTLAAESFTGVASVGDRHLFLLNGRAIGPEATSLDAFDTPTDVRRAPDPALALLGAMEAEGGETTASYYTEETPLSATHETLTERGFTGYVSLSENVLSGDYVTLYYGGRSLDVAFVGAGERLLTDEEARERAEAEVGIYEVVPVDLTVADLPEPSEEPPDRGTEPEGERGAADEADEPSVSSDERTVGPRAESLPPDDGESTSPEAAPVDAVDETTEPVDAEGPGGPGPTTASEPEDGTEPTTAEDAADGPADGDDGTDSSEPPADDQFGKSEASTLVAEGEPESATSESEPITDGLPSGSSRSHSEASDDRLAGERDWRGHRRVPSIDPAASGGDGGAPRGVSEGPTDPEADDGGRRSAEESDPPSSGGGADSTVEEASDTRSEGSESTDALREELASVRAERDALEDDVKRLRETVADLRDRLDRADGDRTIPDSTTDGARTMDPEDALSGTDLFVRYGSKQAATLSDVHAGEAERDALVENLRLSTHTRFDSADVSVAGDPFPEFLSGTIEYRFVEWLVSDLLVEVRESASVSGLADLVDALSGIDRAELRGSVEVGEEAESFDVVLRDRMGEPLLVADLHEDREPASQEPMASLVQSATTVTEGRETLSGAMAVTTSFFDPAALELAGEATRSGLLKGGSRESFVRLSRRRGYHLCLVEAREGGFELMVPEL